MAKLTKAKAKKILSDGIVRGKKLTAKQVKFFGAIASGQKPYKTTSKHPKTSRKANRAEKRAKNKGGSRLQKMVEKAMQVKT